MNTKTSFIFRSTALAARRRLFRQTSRSLFASVATAGRQRTLITSSSSGIGQRMVGVTRAANFCAAAASVTVATPGKVLKVQYKGTLTSTGEVFDASPSEDEPLTFTCGAQEVIKGFDQGVLGMRVGETRTINIPCEDGYGPRHDEAMVEVDIDMPEGTEVGTRLRFNDGRTASVVSMNEGKTVLDFNHRLAGEDLTFEVTLVSCEDAPPPPKIEKTVLKEGDGETYPSRGDTLTMHYTGTLKASGEKFDSSRDRNEPFKFVIGVGQVIKGWDEGVMTMSLGESCVLHVPSELGYGKQGAGGVIPPNADLDFEVELIKVDRA